MKNKQKGEIVLLVGLLVGFFLASLALVIVSNHNMKDMSNYDECLNTINEIMPNPNMTEERSQLLQECVEK